MKKWYYLLFLVVAVGVCYLLMRPADRPVSTTKQESSLLDNQKARVRRFWQHFRSATRYRIAGETEMAVQAYRDALADDPEHEDTLYYLGNLLYEQKSYDQARTMWQTLAQVNPNSTRAYLQLGDFYLNPDLNEFNPGLAEQAYLTALKINKQESRPTLRLGQIALLKNEHVGAEQKFAAVAASNYRSVAAYSMLGYIEWKSGNRDRALEYYKTAAGLRQATHSGNKASGEGDTRTGRVLQQVRILRAFDIDFDDLDSEPDVTRMDAAYRSLDDRITAMTSLADR